MDAQPVTHHSLPPQPTSFVGREAEIAEIAALLGDPACRLLTLVGPGGIGKTRLALEVTSQIPSFPDGVYFVPLQPLDSADFLVPAINSAIGTTPFGEGDPHTQFLSYLQSKSLLLILDNFEQLLAGVGMLAEMLARAPKVKLLVTSRQRLNLREEWVFNVPGLQVPDLGQSVALETCDAVRLFTACARRIRQDFRFADNSESVVRICQQVEGMPLALELAASWLKLFSCAEVAAEIQRGHQLLTTDLRNVPERHQSIAMVFEQSWQLLSEAEQRVFRKLTVFRGGFQREAAQQVTGATLGTLSSLVDQSFIRVDQTGRYDIHELLRQYGEEQFDNFPAELAQAQDDHAIYFLTLLSELESDLKGANQIIALDRIAADIDNVRTAWRWAAARQMETQISRCLDSLMLFYEMRSLFAEAREALEIAMAEIGHERSVLMGCLLAWQGNVQLHTSNTSRPRQNAGADELIWEGIRLLEKLGVERIVSFPLYWLSFRSTTQTHQQLRQVYLESLDGFRRRGDSWATGNALNALGVLRMLEGGYDEAQKYFQESLAIFRANGDQFGIARVLGGVVPLARLERRYQEARYFAGEHLDIVKRIGDKGGIAYALYWLGCLACEMGEYTEAAQYLEESFQIVRTWGGPTYLHIAYLAEVKRQSGDLHQARSLLRDALQINLEDRSQHWTVVMCLGVARLWADEGKQERAVELLTISLEHGPSLHEAPHVLPLFADPGTRADVLLSQLEAALPPAVFAEAQKRGEIADLMTVTRELLQELDRADEPGILPRIDKTDQDLIDPLTAREAEVLQLIADGLTNREIADRLVVVVGTVKSHINAIYQKLHARNRVEAVSRARELSLL